MVDDLWSYTVSIMSAFHKIPSFVPGRMGLQSNLIHHSPFKVINLFVLEYADIVLGFKFH